MCDASAGQPQRKRVSPMFCVRIVVLGILCIPAFTQQAQGPLNNARIGVNARLYIEPNEGFDTFLTAALSKKHVPIDVVADRLRADYVIESANNSQRAGWARIIALGQTGSNEEASVRIVRIASGDIV